MTAFRIFVLIFDVTVILVYFLLLLLDIQPEDPSLALNLIFIAFCIFALTGKRRPKYILDIAMAFIVVGFYISSIASLILREGVVAALSELGYWLIPLILIPIPNIIALGHRPGKESGKMELVLFLLAGPFFIVLSLIFDAIRHL